MKKTIITTIFLIWPILIAYKFYSVGFNSVLDFTRQGLAVIQIYSLPVGPSSFTSTTLLNNDIFESIIFYSILCLVSIIWMYVSVLLIKPTNYWQTVVGFNILYYIKNWFPNGRNLTWLNYFYFLLSKTLQTSFKFQTGASILFLINILFLYFSISNTTPISLGLGNNFTASYLSDSFSSPYYSDEVIQIVESSALIRPCPEFIQGSELLNNFSCAVPPIKIGTELNENVVLTPIKIYYDLNDSATLKLMRAENKNKAGVYRIINKLNGKFYVGSSSSLTNRLNRHYYSPKYQEKKGIQILITAFKKYGIENFSFEILEYCESSVLADLLEREQFYLDLLKPAYNILTIAGSSKGIKLSETTKAKLSDGRRKGSNSVWSGRTHTEEAKLLMTLHNKKTKTLFCYIKNNPEITSKKPELIAKDLKFFKKFNSMREASRHFNCPVSSIQYTVTKGNFYKSTYFFSKIELDID